MKMTAEISTKITELYDKKVGIYRIAKQVGRSPATCKRLLEKSGKYEGLARERESGNDPLDLKAWKKNEFTEIFATRTETMLFASSSGDGQVVCRVPQKYSGKRLRWSVKLEYSHASGPHLYCTLGTRNGSDQVSSNSFHVTVNVPSTFHTDFEAGVDTQIFFTFASTGAMKISDVQLEELAPLPTSPPIDLTQWESSGGALCTPGERGWKCNFPSAESTLSATFQMEHGQTSFECLAHLVEPQGATLACTIAAENDQFSETTPLHWSEVGQGIRCRLRQTNGQTRIALSCQVPFFADRGATVLLRNLRLTASENVQVLAQPEATA